MILQKGRRKLETCLPCRASDMPASDKKVKIEQENTNHSLTDNLCEALRNGLNLDFSADSPAALRQFGASPFQQFNERNAGDSSPIHTDSFVSARQSLSSEEDVDVLQGDFERDSGFLEQNLVDKFNNCVNLNDNSTPTRRISSSTIPKAAPSLAQDRGMSPSPAKFTASPIQDGGMSPSPAKSTASSIQGRELSPSPAKSTTSFIQDRGMSPSPAKSTASSIQDRELSPSPAKPIFSKATNSAGGSALPLKGQGENQTPPQRAPPPTQKGLCTLSETDESDVEDDLQDSKSAGAGLKGTTTISDSSSSDNDETFTERTAALPPTSSARSIDLDQDDADDDFEDEQSDQDDEDYANDGESDEDSIYTPSPKKKTTSTRIQAGNKKEEEESPLFAPVRSATQLRRRPRRNTAVAAAGASREMSQRASRVLHTNNEEDEDEQLESNDFLGKEHTRVPASTPLRLTPPTSPLSIGESTPLPPCEYTPPPKSYKATAAKELVYDLSSSPLALSESTPLPSVESTPPPKSYKATAAKEFDEEFDENSPLPPPRKSTRKGPQKVVFLSSSDEDEDDDYFEEDDDDENDENELSKSNFSIQTSTPLMPKGKAPKRNIRSSRRVESSDEDDEDEESENEYDLEDSFIASDEDLSEEDDEDEDYVDEGSSDEDEDDEDADADSDVEILSVASSSKSSRGVEFCEDDHDDDFSDMSDAEKSIAKIKASKTSKERQNGTCVKDSIKVTKSNREKLARDLLAEFNDTVFGGEIPYDLKITWNARMTSSAGFCFMKCSSDRTRSARIELSSKVITNGERLNTTLLHELCHAAAWLVDGVQKPPHGPAFVKWAERATQVYPRYPVTTCHNYKVHAPFRYECTGCKATWTRHSKSIDVNSMCCSRCKSRSSLVFVGQFDENGNKIEKKKLNAYQQFVKDNYKTVLDEVNDKSKAMGILAERWKEFKAAQ